MKAEEAEETRRELLPAQQRQAGLLPNRLVEGRLRHQHELQSGTGRPSEGRAALRRATACLHTACPWSISEFMWYRDDTKCSFSSLFGSSYCSVIRISPIAYPHILSGFSILFQCPFLKYHRSLCRSR